MGEGKEESLAGRSKEARLSCSQNESWEEEDYKELAVMMMKEKKMMMGKKSVSDHQK